MRVADLDPALLDRLVAIDAARTAEAAARTGHEPRFSTTPFGKALALRDTSRPGEGFLNRVVGFSADAQDRLDELVAHYEAHGIPCQLDLTPDRLTPELGAQLVARGFRYHGGLATFRAIPEPVERSAPPGVETRLVPPDEIDWALLRDVGAVAPDLDEASRTRRVAYLRAHPEVELFVARVDGELAAVATSLVLDDACHLANARTAPDKRGRGAQRALLEHRVDVAARRGRRLAVTDTWFGTTSHRNVERVGFRLAYITSWWRKPLDGAAPPAATPA